MIMLCCQATISRNAVSAFLNSTGIPVVSIKPYTKNFVELRVRREAKRWAEHGLMPERYEKHLAMSMNMATIAFGHTHIDVQVHIALFTILTRCIGDHQVSSLALESFGSRMASGAHQLDPVLNCLVENLSRMSWYFLPHASRSIMAATMDFINATLFDKESVGMKLRDGALPHIEYKRTKNALSGGYGFFVWDKFSFPNISSYIQTIPYVFLFSTAYII